MILSHKIYLRVFFNTPDLLEPGLDHLERELGGDAVDEDEAVS